MRVCLRPWRRRLGAVAGLVAASLWAMTAFGTPAASAHSGRWQTSYFHNRLERRPPRFGIAVACATAMVRGFEFKNGTHDLASHVGTWRSTKQHAIFSTCSMRET